MGYPGTGVMSFSSHFASLNSAKHFNIFAGTALLRGLFFPCESFLGVGGGGARGMRASAQIDR